MNDTDQFLAQQSRIQGPAKVGTQAGLMSLLSVAAIVAFYILRSRNKDIYDPKHGDKVDDKIKNEDSIKWLQRLYNAEESDLLNKYKIGLDAIAFLRFTRMTRNLFVCIALLCCAILMPIDAAYNHKHPSTDLDILSMLTIREVRGSYLLAHVVVSYAISVLVMFFIWINWRQMRDLRQAWFRSSEYIESSHARTLFVTNIPEAYQSDAEICKIFQIEKVIQDLERNQSSESQVPYAPTSGHIGRDVEGLRKLIKGHDDAVRKLEHVLITYPKGKGADKENRLTILVGGVLGMGRKKEDAIAFYTKELSDRKQAVTHCREKIHQHEGKRPYGFVSMADVAHTHRVARALRGKYPAGMDFALAPNPKDFIWKNLDKSPAELSRNRLISFLLLVLVCFFNTIPLLIISTLANLFSISEYVPFLLEWAMASPGTFTLVSGVIPPAVSALFGHFLPVIMRRLTELQGVQTRSRLERIVISHYFAFLVISQLVIFTLMGVFYIASVQVIHEIGNDVGFEEIIHQIPKLGRTISQTYIDQASYWITYFALRGFLMIFDLVRVLNLVFISFKTRAFDRTPRTFREWTLPPYFEYDTNYSKILFLAAVAMVFAPLAPLVSLAGAVVFFISSWTYKYQLMFVSVTHVETGGRLWSTVCNRLLVPVVFMQLLMTLTIGIQDGFKSYIWVATLPPILLVILFKILTYQVFNKKFRYYLPSEMDPPKAKIDLGKRFGHPALHAKLFRPTMYDDVTGPLAEAYKEKCKVEELLIKGGRPMEMVVFNGGLSIAGVNQQGFESHPALYPLEQDIQDHSAQAKDVPSNSGGDNISGDSEEIAEEPASPVP